MPRFTKGRLAAARCLTLKGQWAHAVVHFGKRDENRSKVAPELTDVVLIHAGVGRDRTADTFIRSLGFEPPAREDVVTGAIVAVTELAHVCTASRYSPTLVCQCSAWAMPFENHWRFGDLRVLDEPVPCKGALKLWTPPADVLAAVEAQVAR